MQRKIVIDYLSGSKRATGEIFGCEAGIDLLIGTARGSAIKLDEKKDPGIQANHAKITIKDKPELQINIESLTGAASILVNEKAMPLPYILKPGDVISLTDQGPLLRFDLMPRPGEEEKTEKIERKVPRESFFQHILSLLPRIFHIGESRFSDATAGIAAVILIILIIVGTALYRSTKKIDYKYSPSAKKTGSDSKLPEVPSTWIGSLALGECSWEITPAELFLEVQTHWKMVYGKEKQPVCFHLDPSIPDAAPSLVQLGDSQFQPLLQIAADNRPCVPVQGSMLTYAFPIGKRGAAVTTKTTPRIWLASNPYRAGSIVNSYVHDCMPGGNCQATTLTQDQVLKVAKAVTGWAPSTASFVIGNSVDAQGSYELLDPSELQILREQIFVENLSMKGQVSVERSSELGGELYLLKLATPFPSPGFKVGASLKALTQGTKLGALEADRAFQEKVRWRELTLEGNFDTGIPSQIAGFTTRNFSIGSHEPPLHDGSPVLDDKKQVIGVVTTTVQNSRPVQVIQQVPAYFLIEG